MLKIGLTAAVITAVVLAALPAALSAATADAAAPPAAACIECCEGDALCETLAGLAGLRGKVEALVLDEGLANSLEVKVDAATRSVLAARYGPALHQLDAFDHELSASVASRKISPPSLANLIRAQHEMRKQIIDNFRV